MAFENDSVVLNACSVKIFVEDSGGNMVDISGDATEASISVSNETGTYKTFGSRWRRRLTCAAEFSIDVSIVYTLNVDKATKLFNEWSINNVGNDDSSRYIIIQTRDGAPGEDQFSGYVVLSSLEIPLTADSAEPIVVAASLESTGDLMYEVIQ